MLLYFLEERHGVDISAAREARDWMGTSKAIGKNSGEADGYGRVRSQNVIGCISENNAIHMCAG